MATVLVTGSNAGIGREIALDFARAGYTVYATMRKLERGAELASIAEAEKLPVHLRVMDVDSDDSVRECFAAIHAEGVEIDVLVNNAGIERHGAVEELSMDDIRAVMETNYFGAIRCIHQVVTRMRERGSGCIVNITSVAGKVSSSPLGAYAASKHALEALSDALAMEMKPFGVRVVVVEPGIIDTAMAHAIEEPPPSVYRHARQMSAYFRASLTQPTPPTLVAEVVRNAVESDVWKLRHPAGPVAARSMERRIEIGDDGWIAEHTLSNEEFAENLKAIFGLDVKV